MEKQCLQHEFILVMVREQELSSVRYNVLFFNSPVVEELHRNFNCKVLVACYERLLVNIMRTTSVSCFYHFITNLS